MTIEPTLFRTVLGCFPTGVVVVTALDADGRPVGMACNSFTSVSLDPPLVSFCPAKTSTTWPRMAGSESFCVNILSADQEAVCRRFATTGIDRFAGLAWERQTTGAPVLAGVAAWIDCARYNEYEAGDHSIVLGRVAALGAMDVPPLVVSAGRYGRIAVQA